MMIKRIGALLPALVICLMCRAQNPSTAQTPTKTQSTKSIYSKLNVKIPQGYYAQFDLPKEPLVLGADRTGDYLPYLKGKNVGMLINQSSVIGPNYVSSVDSLLKLGIKIKKIFGPEHGFRGDAADGAKIDDTVDPKTGIPAISLYGKHHKPSPQDMAGLDIMIYDVQDVGTRFYTYITTLNYVMEACAENNVELMILDRPNPNGFLVDGPVLDTAFRSSVGINTIPIAHGMTIAEYAQMVNGEGWLKNKVKCKLHIVKMLNYVHNLPYGPRIRPSPNLNTWQSVLLYPSLCLFEGTTLSIGRGTEFPFQVIGSPLLKGKYQFSFTPVSIPGVSDKPPLKDQLCYGINLQDYPVLKPLTLSKLNLSWIIELYKAYPDKEHFFNSYFTKLAGTDQLRKQIEQGMSEADIRSSWEPQLSQYKLMRNKYLLYK
jgi:uncharacterized protein YbbC (DUF1343 family)